MVKQTLWDEGPFSYLNRKDKTIVSATNTDMTVVFWLVNKSVIELYKQFDNFLEDITTLPKDYYLEKGLICQERYNRFVKFTVNEKEQLMQAFLDRDIEQYKFVLYQRAFKSMSYYIRDVYFEKTTIAVWDDAIQTVQEKYPLVPKYMFEKIQEKKFIKQLAQKIIDSLEKELPTVLPQIVDHKKKEAYAEHNIYTVILYSILDSLLVSLCSDRYLWEAITEHRHSLVNETFAPIQEKKQRQLLLQQEKEEKKKNDKQLLEQKKEDTAVPIDTDHDEQLIDPVLKQQFNEIFSSFENATKVKLWKVHKDVESYIWRMYKKDESIYMKRIQQIVWSSFDDEVVELVRNLCNQLDLKIHELDSVLEEDLQNTSWIATSKRVEHNISDGSDQDNWWDVIVKQVKSLTLEKFKTQPTLLQAEDVIKIFEECGYTIANPRKFSKQLEKYIIGWWSLFEKRKKKIIGYMSLPEDIQQNTEVVRSTVWLYRVMKLYWWEAPRIIRKWNQILACIDHGSYDAIMPMMSKSKNIDHLL